VSHFHLWLLLDEKSQFRALGTRAWEVSPSVRILICFHTYSVYTHLPFSSETFLSEILYPVPPPLASTGDLHFRSNCHPTA